MSIPFQGMGMEEMSYLEEFIRTHWAGTMAAFCVAAGVSRPSLYAWFRGEAEPSLSKIGNVARVLEVRRWEVVAAMDGELAEARAPALPDRVDELERLVARLTEQVFEAEQEPRARRKTRG